jgi:hypothetical protein
VQLLVLGAISGDGTKRHADASKSKAVRYKRLGEIDAQWRAEGEELGALSEQAEQAMLPAGLVGGGRNRAAAGLSGAPGGGQRGRGGAGGGAPGRAVCLGAGR